MRANVWEDVAIMLDDTPGLVNFNYIDALMLKTGKTPLFLAVELCLEGECDISNVEFLLSKGADPNKSSLYEGNSCLPIYLCTTAPKRKVDLALAIATLLLAQGTNLNSYELLENSIKRMIAYQADDYDETMVKFICQNGCFKRQLQRGLMLVVTINRPWVPKVVDCLLRLGAYIYSLGSELTTPLRAAKLYNTRGAEMVRRANDLITMAKNVKDFEYAVHHEIRLDTYVLQWKSYVNNFKQVLKRIQRNERNGFLAMKHPSSTAARLPEDVFGQVMKFITSAIASRRVDSWLSLSEF